MQTGRETYKNRCIKKMRVIGMAPCQYMFVVIQWFYKNENQSFRQTIVL